VRVSQVIGLPVVDTHVARQAGVVSDVLTDLAAGRVAVLNVQHADGYLVQRIPAEYVYRLGPHTVLVADTLAVDMGPPVADARWLRVEALVGLEVMTEGGDLVGHLADAEVDNQTLAVKAYLLRRPKGRWRRRPRVHPDQVLTVSPELMIVRSTSGRPGGLAESLRPRP
jgi:sporulation protein YlmC with PRC-barrel domain